MTQKRVGIRDLKNNLSAHLRTVKHGNVLRISEYGKVFAHIVPAPSAESRQDEDNEEKVIRGLVKAGVASWSGGKPDWPRHPVKIKGKPASQWILENRR